MTADEPKVPIVNVGGSFTQGNISGQNAIGSNISQIQYSNCTFNCSDASTKRSQEIAVPAEKLPSLFISCAREDDEIIVEKLYKDLKVNGFDVWWDRTVVNSCDRPFLHKTQHSIDESDIIIAIIGPKGIESSIVQAEWEHALLFNKDLVPILRIDDCSLLAEEILSLPCHNFSKERPYEEALKELIWFLRKPLGPIIAVPSLPPNYLPRRGDLKKIKELVADTVKPVVITSTKQVTALQGMGGMGKSVLAAAFARTTDTRKAFHDGIFWITVGLEASDSDASGNMRLIGTTLGDDPVNYSSKKEAEASLSKILSDKVCLIILDDIWKVSQATSFVNSLGPHCRLLITTRNYDVVISLGAQEHKIEKLSEPEALKLLASWCRQEVDSLPLEVAEVAKECGYLPLALSICGAMVKSGITWLNILEALQEADLEFIEAQLPNYPDTNVMRALKISVDFLSSEDPNAVSRYRELAIFPPDEFVPEAAIVTLWAHTGNLKKRNSGKLLTKLKDRSLLSLDGETPNRLISLHDLQFDYLRAIADGLPALHNQLLEAYHKECGNKWSGGPEDGYYYEHLAYHMSEAGRKEELRNLLLDYEWMCTKLKKVCIKQDKIGIETPNVNSLIHDYNYFPGDTEIELVQGAIKLSYNSILYDKNQLAGQLLGRLLCFREKGIQALLSQACECKDGIRLLPKTSSLRSPGGSLIRTLEGHEDSVNSVAITPDGRYIVSASDDEMLKVWDLKTGEQKTTLKGHEGSVNEVAITPDGKCAVSASKDGTLKAWNLETGEEKTSLKVQGYPFVYSIATTSDRMYVVLASCDSTLRVCDLETGEEKATLKGHKSLVNAVAVTPDGRYVVSASNDTTLKVWDLKTGEQKTTLKGHEGSVNEVAITPDGKCAVSASNDGTLKVWNLETGEEKTSLKALGFPFRYSVAITPDGKYAVLASWDSTLKVWDLETGEKKTTFKGHDDSVNSVAITPDGKYAVSASDDETLKIWDLEKEEEKTSAKGHRELVNEVAITPDGKYAVSVSWDKTLKIWDLATGEENTSLKGHEELMDSVAIIYYGKYAVSTSIDGMFKVWDLEKGKEKTTLKGTAEDSINTIAVTPDGKHLILGSLLGVLDVWDLDTGEKKTTLFGHRSSVHAVAVTPDGKHAVSASDDETLKVWDLETGEEKITLKGHEESVNAVAITPDARYAVSASWDKTLKIWNLATGEEKTTLYGHRSSVNAVAITSDGKYAVSASNDATLKVWDLKQGGVIISNFTGDCSFQVCDFSPDDKSIIAGDSLGKVHFLYLDN